MMSGAARADGRRLRLVALIAGLGWSIMFVAIGLRYELQAYADGSIFSYSVAVQDAWTFHWHNISSRMFVYLFCFVPAELYVWLTSDPEGGVVLYGLLFFIAPLLGLAATWAADRSRGRIIFGYACASTACLCPLVFGFPTEMWMAHALFWPALALCHYARSTIKSTILIFAVLLAMTLTHGGAVVFAGVILFTLALRGIRDPALVRTACIMAAVMAIWFAVKAVWPPDSYFASIIPAAMWNFIDITALLDRVPVLLFTALAAYGAAFVLISRFSANAQLYAAAVAATGLAVYWLCFDHGLLAQNRYYLRTALLAATPAFAVAATVHALLAESRLAIPLGFLRTAMTVGLRGTAARAMTGGLLVVLLVHAVETRKFVTAWTAYKTAIRALATGTASDPQLGDRSFVSSSRIGPDLERLSWSSTTQYLSVLLAPNFKPNRLVVDPADDYFWISCETATANRLATRAVPAQSRALVGRHACMHRKRLIAAAAPAKK